MYVIQEDVAAELKLHIESYLDRKGAGANSSSQDQKHLIASFSWPNILN